MFCSHCGKEISSNVRFCKYCGNRIEYKNIGNSASETKSPKLKRSSKPIILGGILGLMICIFVVVFFVVNSQKSKTSNLNKTDSKLSSEEAIVTDVKTAGRLQSATQTALTDQKIYEAVCQLDWIYDHDVLIMTINKNGEYIYPEGLDCLAEELKTNCGEDISIKYIEKGADSFNIYLTSQGGVCIYIGSKDNPRKWKVVPDADTLYQVNIEDENTDNEEATEIKKVETIDEAKEADVNTASILQSVAQATLADTKAYSEITNYCDKENKNMKDVLLLTIIDNEHITYVDELKYFAEEIRSNLSDDIRIYYKEKGAVLYSIYFTKEGGIKVYAGTKEKNDMWELVPNTDKLYSLNKEEYYEENDILQQEEKNEVIYPDASNQYISSVIATSYLVEEEFGISHTADRIIDKDEKTAWCEGVSGNGQGEKIIISLKEDCLIHGIRILNGYQKSDELYDKNARPSVLNIFFSDGECESIKLRDEMGWQDFYFDNYHLTNKVEISIQDVYAGTKYEDTLITEIQIY